MIVILYAVYVVHQNSGVCLISENFSEDKFNADSDLISGYLVAFKDVGKEMSKGSGDLKVIDMGIYNLFLVVHKDIIVIGVADKSDDKMIIYHHLSKLQKKFVEKYNSQSELDYWDGQLVRFREFREIIRKSLDEGLVGQVKKFIPIFKMYKKDFVKFIGQEDIKKLKIKEEVYKKAQDSEGSNKWTKEKRFPTQPISQGLLSSLQYEIVHLLDGFHTAEDIASEMNIKVEEVYKNFKRIDDLGLLTFLEIL